MSLPTPYYQDEACKCGCGMVPGKGRRFISGHNLKGLEKTESHRRNISAGQRKAWTTKRTRMPVGSKNKDANGYIRVKVVPGLGEWKKEHILKMEAVIGRPLRSGEMVHHINGSRDDNRVENLFLCESSSQHNAIHASFEKLLAGLLNDGIVRFNHSAGRYER